MLFEHPYFTGFFIFGVLIYFFIIIKMFNDQSDK